MTSFIGPVLTGGVVVVMPRLLVELPAGAYAHGGPNFETRPGKRPR